MKYPTTEAGWWRQEFEATCELLRAERAELTRLRTAHADLLRRCDSADHATGHDPVSARTPAGRISTDTVRAVLGGGADMPDEFEPYFTEAMKRPGFRAAYEAAEKELSSDE